MLIEEQDVEGCLKIEGFTVMHSENPCDIDVVDMGSFDEIMYSLHKTCYDRIISPCRLTSVAIFVLPDHEVVRKTGENEFIFIFSCTDNGNYDNVISLTDEEDCNDVVLSKKNALFIRNDVTVTFHPSDVPVKYVIFCGIEEKD